MELNYIVMTKDNNKAIKDILISKFKISHRLLTTLKKQNAIFLNDEPTFIYKNVQVNDKITISFDYQEDNSNIISLQMPLNIIYEDDWLLVVNKPAGIPVHPSIEHYYNSLSSGVKFYFDQLGLKKKIRPVNRIDRNTSGIVIFAKNEYLQEILIRQMQTGEFSKKYIAIVGGILEEKQTTIDKPISRKLPSIMEREVNENGEKAITHYKVKYENKDLNLSVIEIKLETGRTHQIRVHTKYIGHPILGDDLYDNPSALINRQALHSYNVSFTHPILNENVNLTAEIPEDMKLIIEKIKS